MSKSELRTRLRARYRQSDSSVDGRIAELVFAYSVYQQCECIFLYVGVGTEIDTMPIVEDAIARGKKVALPKSFGKGVMEFYRYTGKLIEGMYHIPEPVSDEVLVPGERDLMIVPGLAFDRRGYRLGQGAGYYDRYLSEHRCSTLGLCRSEFLLEKIPVSWNDLPVDCVITENGTSEEAPF